MEPIDRYLYEDKITAKKILEDPSYYDRLEKANVYVEKLGIDNKIDYYRYSIVFDDLKCIPYMDTQSFKRFQDKDYFEYVKSHITSKKI